MDESDDAEVCVLFVVYDRMSDFSTRRSSRKEKHQRRRWKPWHRWWKQPIIQCFKIPWYAFMNRNEGIYEDLINMHDTAFGIIVSFEASSFNSWNRLYFMICTIVYRWRKSSGNIHYVATIAEKFTRWRFDDLIWVLSSFVPRVPWRRSKKHCMTQNRGRSTTTFCCYAWPHRSRRSRQNRCGCPYTHFYLLCP